MDKPLKMIVSDLDGTLLKNHLEITKFTQEVIQKAKAKGLLFVVATGRPMQTIKTYLNHFDFIDYFIVSNGMAVFHPKTNTFIINNTFEISDLETLLPFSEINVSNFDIHAHEGIYYKGPLRKTYFDGVLTLHEKNDAPTVYEIKELPSLDQLSVTKIMWIEEDLKKYAQLSDLAKCLNTYQIVQSEKSYIDFNLKGISKGSTLKHLAEILNIKQEAIIAFGDQGNDQTMIEYAGIGVAMENAVPDLKRVANDIAKSSDDEGVAHYLKQILNLN